MSARFTADTVVPTESAADYQAALDNTLDWTSKWLAKIDAVSHVVDCTSRGCVPGCSHREDGR